MKKNQLSINRYRVTNDDDELESDVVAVEEPLQILLEQYGESYSFSITMRTPGEDLQLVSGLLFCEAVINSASDILSVDETNHKGETEANVVTVKLSDHVALDLSKHQRSHTSYSGCGFCGKTNLKALELKSLRQQRPIKSQPTNLLIKQLRTLLGQQNLFTTTGGTHVAGLVYEKVGKLDIQCSPFFEDVGRHNALDKLIGHELQQNDLSQPGILLLSGRIGFELVQKVIVAGFSTIVALGAPSSLAIQAANQFGITLIGFAKNDSYNLYTSQS